MFLRPLNKFQTSQLFSESWKAARVTPVFKEIIRANGGIVNLFLILPVLARLFEKPIFNQLCKYLNDNNLLSQEESGFRTLHRTVSCLLRNTSDW